jgi:ATP-dependent exoDNAse (exonuclease V) beta subunit
VSVLADQPERDRFVQSYGQNISVIAPAGVGKTRAIVERIVHLAKLPEAQAVDRLPRLVVVTYSVRAAQEMQQRTRAALRGESISPQVQRAFQQTFFGTIHSYCVRLLDRFGHYLGLPSSVALLRDDEEMWSRFLMRGLDEGTAAANLGELFHFYPPEKLYALGRTVPPGDASAVGPLPMPDFTQLLDYPSTGLNANTRKSVAAAQAAVKRWSEAWARGDRFHELPHPPGAAAPVFMTLWTNAFAPLHDWLRVAALAFGRRLANAYEAFRLSEAVMTYDDQVRLALRVLKNTSVRRELAADRLSVLLDEAQDTDPLQFEVLLRVAGLRGEQGQAEDQSFCIVGDFQQAIYAPRSDLAAYRLVDEEISSGPRGARSLLQVTFRCDRALINLVNNLFPALLDGGDGQSPFTVLIPRDDAGPGQVVRWHCPGQPKNLTGKKIKVGDCAKIEAEFLAREIARHGLAGLGGHRWSDIAVLCPRRDWLVEIQRGLLGAGLPVQLHSSDEAQGDLTPRAWLTALIWVAAHPEDEFEIAGVLREIFGVSDHDMALFTEGEGSRLRLDRPVRKGGGPVASALGLLLGAMGQTEAQPLHSAIRRLIERTQLRERLLSLGGVKGEVQRQLDDFLALIKARCAERATLAELAAELRSGLALPAPAEEEVHDAIQLLTSHKAKGLEWPVVIVPFLFRPIGFKNPAYPRLVRDNGGTEIICRDGADFAAVAKTGFNRRERQQLQRLLYVMATRARHSLLLIDDGALFEGTQRSGTWISGDLLGLSESAIWTSLPENFSSHEIARPIAALDEQPLPVPTLISKSHLLEAVERAAAIPRRLTPHALAAHSPRESEPEARAEKDDPRPEGMAENPGIRYGTWWHEFFETIPWLKARQDWQQKFEEALPRSPQPERSRREWDCFLSSTLAAWLAAPGRLSQVEMPFLWHESDRFCVEGVIDLAIFTPAESAWCVIDWKTNTIGPEGGAGLVEIYRDQIRAYVRALREMLSAEVRGSLYLTQSGEWIEVD